MALKSMSEKPEWLLSDPQPELQMKRFHSVDVPVWVGEANIAAFEGWNGNPRTELMAEQFYRTYGRKPTNEEMYNLVLADDDPKEGLKIRELAGSIQKNGLRVPLVLTFDRKLLDGNRRYYASMFLAADGAPPQERKNHQKIAVWVLPKGVSPDVEDAVITEFNFLGDFRIEWPYFVKAMRVYEDRFEHDMREDALEIKYGQPWRTLKTWIRAAELCEQFLAHHDSSFNARQFAYRHFIMFDEMARRYKSRFDDTDFREAIFDILLADYPDNPRFRSSSDVIKLAEIRSNQEAWDTLTSRRGTEALKAAQRILEVAVFDSSTDPNPKLRRIVKQLSQLNTSGSLNIADEELLDQFQEQVAQLPGSALDPADQVRKMIYWLDNMTSREIALMRVDTLDELRKALQRVLKMAEAVSEG